MTMGDAANIGKLAKKLVDIMAAVERIPKRGWNEFHKYHYALEADVLDAVRVEMASRGVLLLPAIIGRSREPVGEKGEVVTHLDMEFTFIDSDTGEMITRPWLGAGADKSDKGCYKGMTGAEKFFLTKTFLIPTGDDPEADEQPRVPRTSAPAKPTAQGKSTTASSGSPLPGPPSTPDPKATAMITDDQRKRFYAVAKANGWTKPEAAALIKRVLNVESSKQIPAYRYKEIVRMLEAGVDAQANGTNG